MPKKVTIISLIFASLLSVLLFFLYSLQITQKKSVNEELSLSIQFKLNNFQYKKGSLNTNEVLKLVKQNGGVTKKTFIDTKNNTCTPSNIEVIFDNINNEKNINDRFHTIKSNSGEIVHTQHNYVCNNETLTINAFYLKSYLDSIDPSLLSLSVTNDFLQILIYALHPSGELGLQINYPKKPLLTIEKKISAEKILDSLNNFFVGTVHAAVCSGGVVYCGDQNTICSCSTTGGTCTQAGTVCGSFPNAGTCQCNTTCEHTNSPPASCSNYNQSQCNAVNNGGGGCYRCPGDSLCSWSCNANQWGSWGSCSASCGGGTQTRTNDCGGTQSQSCNTQPCETCSSTTFESRNECGPIGSCDTTQRRTGINKSTPGGLWNCSDQCQCSEACACGSWTNGACGAGGCAANQRRQTRNCDNGVCNSYAESRCVADATCAFPVTGTVYEDPYRQATLNGTFCDLAGATGVEPGAGSTVDTTYQTAGVNSDGTFSVLALGSPPSRTVTLNIADALTWVCTCPAGCSYAVNQVPPGTSGVNYYVSQTRASWFQTIGGDVHAGNGGGNLAIHNPIPASCQTPGCKPYTTTRDSSGTTGSSGVISYNNGTVDSYGSYGSQTQNLDEDARSYLVNTNRDKPVENFAYFMRHFEMPLEPADDFPNDSYDAAYPTNPSVGGKPAYYQGGDLTILNNPWNVAAGDGRVIFVDGNLTISNTIDVAVGGSLIFIVSGNIIFPSTFGSADPTSTTSLVDGIFIADGTIDIQSVGGLTPDLKFIGEGSFIGHSGVNLSRDFHSTDNNTNPAELFRFRPDLVVNITNAIKKPIFSWKQATP